MDGVFWSGYRYDLELNLGIISGILICCNSHKIIYRDFYGTLLKSIQGYLYNKIRGFCIIMNNEITDDF
jgi:hypothetical protein